MTSAKTAMLTFRIEPELKEAVRIGSVNGHLSIANMIAVMIRDHCGRVEIQEQKKAYSKLTRKPTMAGASNACR
jgi:hypothetical protein